MSSEKFDGMKCGQCGSEAMGRFDAAFLEKMGWRKAEGAWICSACTGLFWAQLEDKPEVMEWLEAQKEKLDKEEWNQIIHNDCGLPIELCQCPDKPDMENPA